MIVEHNHDGHEMVVRLLTTEGKPSSAYIVVSWENLPIFDGHIYKQVEEHLNADDNKPF